MYMDNNVAIALQRKYSKGNKNIYTIGRRKPHSFNIVVKMNSAYSKLGRG